MAKSECRCEHFSCESMLKKTDNGYEVATDCRFRFVKDNDGAITSQIVLNNTVYTGGVYYGGDIPSCEIDLVRKKREENKISAEKIVEEKIIEKKGKKKKKPNVIKRDKRVDFSYGYSY